MSQTPRQVLEACPWLPELVLVLEEPGQDPDVQLAKVLDVLAEWDMLPGPAAEILEALDRPIFLTVIRAARKCTFLKGGPRELLEARQQRWRERGRAPFFVQLLAPRKVPAELRRS